MTTNPVFLAVAHFVMLVLQGTFVVLCALHWQYTLAALIIAAVGVVLFAFLPTVLFADERSRRNIRKADERNADADS